MYIFIDVNVFNLLSLALLYKYSICLALLLIISWFIGLAWNREDMGGGQAMNSIVAVLAFMQEGLESSLILYYILDTVRSP